MDARVTGVDLYNASLTGSISKTLNSIATDSDHVPVAIVSNDCYAVEMSAGEARMNKQNVFQTLRSRMGTGGGNAPMVLFFNDRRKCDYHEAKDNIAPACVAKYGTGGGNTPLVAWETDDTKAWKERKYSIRKLTPTECARLQGFPDWWTDGAKGSDSAIYKMWGNGIATALCG